MKPRRVIELLVAVVGVIVLIFGVVPAAQSTISPQPFHYVCSVSSETNIGVSNCFMNLIGPEPDGSYYAGAGLSFFSLSCASSSSTWNPSITWQFSPGNTSIGIFPSPEHYPSLPSQIVLTWTINVPGYQGTAQGTATLTPTAGTNSFANQFNPQYPSCTQTTTSTTSSTSSSSTVSTSATSTSTITTSTSSGSPRGTSGGTTTPPGPGLNPIAIGIGGALIVGAAGDAGVLSGRRRR